MFFSKVNNAIQIWLSLGDSSESDHFQLNFREKKLF